jgi:hypothetical protein
VRLAAVSVDLDEIPNYFQIHGLEPRGNVGAVYDVAVDRLMQMAKDAEIPLTLFAIGSDLVRKASADKLRAAREAGHEIANHTLGHRYDLTRLDRGQILLEIEEGARAIERACGERPAGFRAPGYTITDEVFRALEELGVAYDSSVFPCPAYYALKTTAIGLIAARGRRSQSIVDTPRVLTAPTRPYRVGKPYWKRGAGILEIPIQVTRGPRLPFIGTTVVTWGAGFARALAKMCVGEPLVNLELHGIDVLDWTDGLEALRGHQHDVKVKKEKKLEALHAAYQVLKDAGYTFVTMAEAALAVGDA